MPEPTVAALRERTPYEEAELSQNGIDGVSNLTVWFVEPELNPKPGPGEVARNAKVASERSAVLVQRLNASEPCVDRLFDAITLIAVDSAYNAWLIVGITPSQLPAGSSPSNQELVMLQENFNIGYARSTAPQPFEPEGQGQDTCTWPEVREVLANLMDSAYPSRGYHYYIDDEGGAIWIQWNIPASTTTADEVREGFLAPLFRIDEAVSCLQPEFKTLWLIYVWPTGEAYLIAAVDGEAVRDQNHQRMIDLLEIVYRSQP